MVVVALATSVALPCLGRAAEDLDAVRSLQRQGRWAASGSLATRVLKELESQPKPDSLAIAEAFHRIGEARWKRKAYADSVGPYAAARALGIRSRQLPADDLDLAASHLVL